MRERKSPGHINRVRYSHPMPRTGRPPTDNPRRNVDSIRTSDDERALMLAAADKAGLGIGPWMRARLLDSAKRSARR